MPRHLETLDTLQRAEAAPDIEVLQGGQVLVHRGRGPLGRRDEVTPVVADGTVLCREGAQRVAVGRGLLEPGEVSPDRAEVGARAVPGQRRVLEVIRVLGEQRRVLRSQSRRLDYLAGCVLSSHTWRLLLRMTVFRDSDGAARRDLLLRRPLRISAPGRLH